MFKVKASLLSFLFSGLLFAPNFVSANPTEALNREGITSKKSQVSGSKARKVLAENSDTQAQELPLNQEIVIDTVIASVDGLPITLQEFSESVGSGRKINLSDFAKDPNLVKALDAMIMERLIEAEANSRKLKATAEDLERYTSQVAAQNHLTKTEFELALHQQGKTLEDFNKQARIEILKSRLISQIAQSAPAVTDQELVESVGEPNDESEEAANQAVRYKLREIVILKSSENEDAHLVRQQRIESRIEAGEEFSKIAKEESQSSSALNGGELGEVAEEDLSEAIKDALIDLEQGHSTPAIDMGDSIRFFYLDKKFESGQASEAVNDNKEQLRKELERRKLDTRLQQFFTVELPKLHKVDRKV